MLNLPRPQCRFAPSQRAFLFGSVPEPVPTRRQQPRVLVCPQLHTQGQWLHLGSLKSATVGMFTPQKLAKAASPSSLPTKSWRFIIYQRWFSRVPWGRPGPGRAPGDMSHLSKRSPQTAFPGWKWTGQRAWLASLFPNCFSRGSWSGEMLFPLG